jgi:hypothetical protein
MAQWRVDCLQWSQAYHYVNAEDENLYALLINLCVISTKASVLNCSSGYFLLQLEQTTYTPVCI